MSGLVSGHVFGFVSVLVLHLQHFAAHVSETSILYTEDGDSSLYSIGGSSRSLFLSSLYAINTYIDFPEVSAHACMFSTLM